MYEEPEGENFLSHLGIIIVAVYDSSVDRATGEEKQRESVPRGV